MEIMINGMATTEYYCESDVKYAELDLQKKNYGILTPSDIEIVEVYARGDYTAIEAQISGIINIEVDEENVTVKQINNIINNMDFGRLENVEWEYVD